MDNDGGGENGDGKEGSEISADEAIFRRKVVSVCVCGEGCAIRSLVSAGDLQLVLHETLLYLFLCMAVKQCYG